MTDIWLEIDDTKFFECFLPLALVLIRIGFQILLETTTTFDPYAVVWLNLDDRGRL